MYKRVNFQPRFIVQDAVSLRTASLLIKNAIRHLLNTLPTTLSKADNCGLGVRGVLTPEDTVGEVSVVGFRWRIAERKWVEGLEGGFAVREVERLEDKFARREEALNLDLKLVSNFESCFGKKAVNLFLLGDLWKYAWNVYSLAAN